MTLRQRQPRISDLKYLAWLRKQRCACCGQTGPCDAAHLRASSSVHGKSSGIGQKPDDRWALPLKHAHHMSQHFYGDEVGWWVRHGVSDPFALCIEYYERFKQEQEK